jgi:uncharacterized protein YjbI with pentapeptide repeats
MVEIKTHCCGEVICKGSSARYAVIYAVAEGISLQYADLKYKNLSGMDLRGIDLRYADLSGANLILTDLEGADLSGCDLTTTHLCDTILTGADISGTHFIEGSCADNLIVVTDAEIRDLGAII